MKSTSITSEYNELGRSDLPWSPFDPFNSLACGDAQSLNLRGKGQTLPERDLILLSTI